jgi:hypothetical protein
LSSEDAEYLCGYPACPEKGTILKLWVHENRDHRGKGATFQIRKLDGTPITRDNLDEVLSQ